MTILTNLLPTDFYILVFLMIFYPFFYFAIIPMIHKNFNHKVLITVRFFQAIRNKLRCYAPWSRISYDYYNNKFNRINKFKVR